MPGKEIDSKGIKGREPKEQQGHSKHAHEHLHEPHHEMGKYHDGSHHHDHHRGKSE